jgi:3-oxoacyl-[acyl-carrier protein] reductase
VDERGVTSAAQARRLPDNLRLDLSGRTAIITGAGTGVGRGAAIAFASLGANVVVAARRALNGQPVVDEITAAGGTAALILTDVTDRSAVRATVEAAVERYGGLDIMMHNALGDVGVPRYRLEDADLAMWEVYSRVTVWGSWHCAQAAYPHLRRSRHGRMIIVSSESGIEGSHNVALYSPVKAAQRAIVKSLAREWGPDAITVNAIAPLTITEKHDPYALEHDRPVNPVYLQRIRERVALPTMGQVSDTAATLAWLASDGASYVTGQTVICDGGSFVGL